MVQIAASKSFSIRTQMSFDSLRFLYSVHSKSQILNFKKRVNILFTDGGENFLKLSVSRIKSI